MINKIFKCKLQTIQHFQLREIDNYLFDSYNDAIECIDNLNYQCSAKIYKGNTH